MAPQGGGSRNADWKMRWMEEAWKKPRARDDVRVQPMTTMVAEGEHLRQYPALSDVLTFPLERHQLNEAADVVTFPSYFQVKALKCITAIWN